MARTILISRLMTLYVVILLVNACFGFTSGVILEHDLFCWAFDIDMANKAPTVTVGLIFSLTLLLAVSAWAKSNNQISLGLTFVRNIFVVIALISGVFALITAIHLMDGINWRDLKFAASTGFVALLFVFFAYLCHDLAKSPKETTVIQ